MTSVPKPFKFLKTHYKALEANYATIKDSSYKVHTHPLRKCTRTSCRRCP